ncbi:hypothetical protein INT45_001899 [Circinella minor]|uniref:Uncharacterized protein n=1 Tax=Circinella minor TaxID=1195481 RepID=A0A8H7RZZ1_9FUNG|nr:hypothetical protein INT45_001899 [Circinella minor]
MEINGESGSSSLSSSASKRSSDIPLSTGVKDFVNDIYTTKLKHPKWQLPTGKIVEDTMHEFVKQCIYEHSSHSVILDVMDSCWRTYFTPDEMKEIRNYHKPQLKPLPVELKEYLDKFRDKHDIEKLIDTHMHNRFHPSQVDLHWAEKAIGDILDLYYYNYDIDDDNFGVGEAGLSGGTVSTKYGEQPKVVPSCGRAIPP